MSRIKKTLSEWVMASPQVNRGSIIEVKGNSIFVSSPDGLKEFSVPDNSRLKAGDVVRFQGSTLLGRVQSAADNKIVIV